MIIMIIIAIGGHTASIGQPSCDRSNMLALQFCRKIVQYNLTMQKLSTSASAVWAYALIVCNTYIVNNSRQFT
jgi:hypothetical protein